MPDKKQKLYESLKTKGLYTKSFEDFNSQFSDPEKVGKLYEKLSARGLYTRSGSDFTDQFFPDLKKKVSSEGLDNGQETSGTPSPVSQNSPTEDIQEQTNLSPDQLNPNIGLKPTQGIEIGSILTGPGNNPFDINPKAKPVTPGLESAMSAYAGAQGQEAANKVNELSANRPNEQVSIDTENVGNRAGYVGNKLLQGIGSIASGLVDIGLNAGKTLPLGIAGGIANDAVIGEYRKNIAPKVRDYLKEKVGFEVDKGAEKTYDNEFITSSIGGLAQSAPAMLSGYTGLLLQGYDAGLQSINNSDPNGLLDEETKTIYASGLGLVQSALEKVGLDKIMKGNTTILSRILFDKAVREAAEKSSGKVTGDLLEEYINNNIKGITGLFAKGGAKAVEGFLAEFGTGASQEAAAIGSEFLLNEATGKPIFDTSKEKTWDGFIKRVAYAGAQEGVGGFIMGPFFNNSRKAKVNEAQNKIQAISTQLDNPNLSLPAAEALTRRKIELQGEIDQEAEQESKEQKLLPPAALNRAAEIDEELNKLYAAIDDPELSEELRPEIQAQIDALNEELNQVVSQQESQFKKNDLVNYTDEEGNVTQVPVESVSGDKVKVGINKDGIYTSIEVPVSQISSLNAPVITSVENTTDEPTQEAQKAEGSGSEVTPKETVIEHDLKNGDKIEADIMGKKVKGTVTGVGTHKGQIVVDFIDEQGNGRFVYGKQIEKLTSPESKQIEANEQGSTDNEAKKTLLPEPAQQAGKIEDTKKTDKDISQIENSLEKLDYNEGYTHRDLANELSELTDDFPDLEVAIKKYQEELEYDRSLAGRGDMDSANEVFENEVRSIIKKNKPSKKSKSVKSDTNFDFSNTPEKDLLDRLMNSNDNSELNAIQNELKKRDKDQKTVGNPEYKSKPQSKGRSTYIRTPDGDKIEGTYKVVSADDVLASHNEITFAQTENFPTTETGTTVNDRDYSKDRNAQGQVVEIASNFDSRAINDTPVVDSNGIVISGNNRTMSRKLAATNKTDATYLEELIDKADMFGVDPESIKGIKNPMLVFEPKTNMPYTTETFAKFNKVTGKEKGPIEKAVEIAKTITDKARRQISSIYENATKASDITSDSKNAKELKDVLIGNKIIDQKELPRYFDINKNVFTKEGVAFLENLLMGGALNEASLRALDAESMGDVRKKIIGSVVQLTRNSALGENSLADNISNAIEIANKLKKSGLSLQEYVAQGNIFDDSVMSDTDFMVASALEDGNFKGFLQNYNDNVGSMDLWTGKERDKKAVTNDYIDNKYGKSADQIRKNLASDGSKNKGEVRKDSGNVQQKTSGAPEGKTEKEVAEVKLNETVSSSVKEQVSKLNDLIKAQESKIKQAISNMAGISDRAKVAKVMDPLNAEYNRLKQIKKDLEKTLENGGNQSPDQDAKVLINAMNPLTDLMGVVNRAQEKFISSNVRKVEDIVSGLLNTWLESKNYFKRNAAQIATAIFNGIPRSQKILTGKLEMTGGMNKARHDAKKLLDQLYNLVGGDLDKLEQVHQMLDPDLYASLGKPPLGAVSRDVQLLHDELRGLLDDVHRRNFALGFIDQETYDKYNGTYTPRMYETNEIPDDVQQLLDDQEKFNPVTQMETGQFKKRKDLEDLSQRAKDDVLKDPVYSTVKRLMQLDQNAAIANYINQIISNSPNLVKDPASGDIPKGYQLLSGKGYGKLNGKYVPNYIAEDFKGFFMLQNWLNKGYDFIKAYDKLAFRQFLKKSYTVFNPVVQLGNFISNFTFAFASGIDPVTFATNIPKAYKALKSEGAEFQTLLRAGILQSDTVVHDLIPLKAKAGVLPKDQNIFMKAVRKVDEKATEAYQMSDDLAKMNAYITFREQGFSQAQAIQKVYEGFQNYATVGKMWDAASKVPFVGPAFIKFQADLLRIIKNGVTKTPLTTAMYLASLNAVPQMLQMAGLADEEDEDKEALRTGRDFIPKVPLGFTDIPLVYKTNFGEVNLARYLSPFYMFDTGDASSSMNLVKKLLPVGFISKQEAGKGNETTAPALADPLAGTLFEAMFGDTDFRGKSIKDPESTRYRGSGATVEEEIVNKATFLGRSWIPQGANIHDFYLSQKYGEDFYGRTRNTAQSLLNMVVKVQDWQDGDYKKTAVKKVDVELSRIKNLSDERKNIIANFGDKIKNANQDYYENRITKEQYERRISEFRSKAVKRLQGNAESIEDVYSELNEFVNKNSKFLK